MATAGDMRDQIKSDLVINSTDFDTQILSAIHAALRQYRGKRLWFLEASDTLTTSSASETVSLPDDFSAPGSFELIYQSSRLSDGAGFDYLTFDRLKRQYWTTYPLQTSNPVACAIYGGALYLSCLANGTYSIPCFYYKQDETLPQAAETSVWFDDGYDAIRTLAQYIFKRDAKEYTPSEADGDMVNDALVRLGETHVSIKGGR